MHTSDPRSNAVTTERRVANQTASTATSLTTAERPRRPPHHRRHRRRRCRHRRHRCRHLHPWTAVRSCPSVEAAAVTAAHARAAAPTWADAGATSTAPADWTAARMLRSTHPPSRGVTGSASTARADRGASTATSPRTALSHLSHLRHLRHLHRLCHLYHLHGRLYRLHLHRLHYRLKSAVSAASSECSRADVTATPPCARCLPARLLRHRCTPFPRLHLRPVPVQSRNRLQPRPWCSPSRPVAM